MSSWTHDGFRSIIPNGNRTSLQECDKKGGKGESLAFPPFGFPYRNRSGDIHTRTYNVSSPKTKKRRMLRRTRRSASGRGFFLYLG